MSDFHLDCRAHLVMGEGKLLVQSGSVYGIPSLVIFSSKHVGVPGTAPVIGENSAEDPEVLRDSVILTFKSKEHRDAVQDALLGVAA